MKDSAGEAHRWLRQAEHDLEFARLALREGYFGQTCFIAQQAAEKAVKAIHYHRGERAVLGHSVVRLAEELAADVPEIEELREVAGTLDQYYVPTRYPNGLPGGLPFEAYNQAQARAAIIGAGRFVDLAATHIRA